MYRKSDQADGHNFGQSRGKVIPDTSLYCYSRNGFSGDVLISSCRVFGDSCFKMPFSLSLSLQQTTSVLR